MEKQNVENTRPSAEQLERELERLEHSQESLRTIKGALLSLLVFAAIAVLVSTFLLPFRVKGSSMAPTLQQGEILVFIKPGKINRGDIVVFHHEGHDLIKRVIACSGDLIDIDQDGLVTVNGERLEEPYLSEQRFGKSNLEFPFEVPDSRLFVMGDNRAISQDSRIAEFGTLTQEQINGKAIFRVWPFLKIGSVR